MPGAKKARELARFRSSDLSDYYTADDEYANEYSSGEDQTTAVPTPANREPDLEAIKNRPLPLTPAHRAKAADVLDRGSFKARQIGQIDSEDVKPPITSSKAEYVLGHSTVPPPRDARHIPPPDSYHGMFSEKNVRRAMRVTSMYGLGNSDIKAFPQNETDLWNYRVPLADGNVKKSTESSQPPEIDGVESTNYPTSWRRAIIMTALCLAVFCMALDNTIIATAIPKITDEFHALEDVAWYGSAYLLTTAAFQLFFGRLYSFFSIKLVFLIAVGIFEAGSLLCGAAPTSSALIVGRAIAGIGAAGIFSGCILIIAYSVPLHQRPIYTGLAGSMYGIASVAGPLLGGVFSDHVTWRWCFYINLPIGGVTLAFILFFFKNPTQQSSLNLSWREKLRRLDFPGTAIFIPAIICLILALQWGGTTYPWSDPKVLGPLVAAIVLLALFVFIQWRQQENATVPPRVLLQRSVAGATWYAFAFGASFFLIIYYVPIWLQGILGVSATQSGIDSLPLVLTVALFSVVSGIGVTLEGHYTPWMLLGSVIMSVGAGLLSTLKVNSGSGTWIGYQVLAGCGYGMAIQNPLIVVQAVLPMADVPVGTATIMFAQTLGGSLFLAVGQNVFLNSLVKNVQAFAPGFTAAQLLQLGATSLASSGIKEPVLSMILLAYNNALQTVFIAAAAMAAFSFVGAAFIEWKSVKGQMLMGGG